MSTQHESDGVVHLHPRGPFAVGQAQETASGASQLAVAAAERDHIHLAFVPDGHAAAVGACVRRRPGESDESEIDGEVVVELFGDVPHRDRVVDQVARILSLDVDATTWPAVGRRDPVVGRCKLLGRVPSGQLPVAL